MIVDEAWRVQKLCSCQHNSIRLTCQWTEWYHFICRCLGRVALKQHFSKRWKHLFLRAVFTASNASEIHSSSRTKSLRAVAIITNNVKSVLYLQAHKPNVSTSYTYTPPRRFYPCNNKRVTHHSLPHHLYPNDITSSTGHQCCPSGCCSSAARAACALHPNAHRLVHSQLCICSIHCTFNHLSTRSLAVAIARPLRRRKLSSLLIVVLILHKRLRISHKWQWIRS